MNKKLDNLNVHVSEKILHWEAEWEGSTNFEREKQNEAYKMWCHAENILKKKIVNAYDIVDCVPTLRISASI